MLTPGARNPRVVDTYSLSTKLYLLGSVISRMTACRFQRSRTLDQFPGTLQVQTRSGCNSHCLLCPQDTVTKMFPEQTMDEALYRRIADEAAADGRLKAFALVLQNEPLRDPALAPRIRYFQDRNTHGAIVFIVTNGSLLTPERADELIDAGLDLVHISANGDQRDDFEAINRGRRFETFQENVDALLARDLSRLGVHISFIMNAPHAEALRRAVARYRARGVRVHVHGISNRGGLVDAELIRAWAAPRPLDTLRNRVLKPVAKRLLPCCPYPFFQCSVLASGQVLLCTHDWSRRTIVGDLNRQTIREVWNGEPLRSIRRQFLAGRQKEIPACAQCNVYDELAFV